jgi:serine/threonine-protein kinase
MAPEQVTGADVVPQTDLFAVGVLLYEMVSGQKPFAGDSVPAITHQIMNSRPAQPPQAGWGLWQAIDQALEKSAALRFASAEAFIAALRDSAFAPPPPPPAPTGYGMTAYGPPPAYPAPAPSPPPTGMHQPYNPYGAAPPGPMMVPPPGSPPNLSQLPLYYPSKMPRPPILDSEAKKGLGKVILYLLLALTLIGLAVGLVAGGIWFADNVAAESAPPAGSPQGAPPALGPPSEAALSEGIELGPDAGRLLEQAAQEVGAGASESFDEARRERWDRATELIVEAVEAGLGAEAPIRVRGAELFFAAAQELAAQGERARALEALSRASGLLPAGSDDYRRQIEALELSLSRG